jgi:hypothetical protein
MSKDMLQCNRLKELMLTSQASCSRLRTDQRLISMMGSSTIRSLPLSISSLTRPAPSSHQIRNELSQKRRNDELAQLTAAKVDPVSSTPPLRHMRSMSSLSLRQEAYRRKRTASNIEPTKTTEDESEDDQSAAMHSLNSLSEIKVSAMPLSESPTRLSRLSRAMNAALIGHYYPEELTDKAKMTDDIFGQSVCLSLKDQSAEGKKRHAQDLLMLREMRAGVLPEQLLKRIPRMGNLISIDLSHYGIGDALGKCLGTRYNHITLLRVL